MYKDLFSCTGKLAIVTGGCGLLGKEIVRGLHEFGATVYIADICVDEADKLTKDKNIHYIHFDITLESSVNYCLDKILLAHDKVDILVNSAYPKMEDWGTKFEQIPYNSWKSNVNDHLGGYFLCCQKVAEHMKKRHGGSIINLSSIYGVVAPDFFIYEGTDMTMPAAYSAIKGGIIAFTKYLASYYANSNVRANVISPGGIYNNQSPSFVKKYSLRTPLGRMGTPNDIVGAAIFLASDASSYITGHNLIVDGGWTAW